jgi:N-acetylglucosaminyldiphosphoundecaprenol N-acetyl-beta-D-mannosaminyltransferase
LESRQILGTRVDATTYAEASGMIVRWAQARETRYVCIANVHMVMEAYDSADYRRVVNEADMVTSDGMPLVWGLRKLGLPHATRVYGPDLMPRVLEDAAARGVPIGLYGGGSDESLADLATILQEKYPALVIAFREAPPFRPLTPSEDEEVVRRIDESGARILFVALGCPKQERWMAEHRDRLSCVMLGVGAAFDFLAGVKPKAPAAMQRAGFEWLFRFASEPRRLWRRYLVHNPRFMFLFALQLLKLKRFSA